MLILYHSSKSSASRRVRLFLEEKLLDYDVREIDLSKHEQHSKSYLKINPMGLVPTVLHDGRSIHESGTICEYIEAVYRDPPLCPTDPYDMAIVRNWIRYVDGLIGNLIRFNWRHLLQQRAEAMTDTELQAMISRIPNADRREAWLRVARRPYTKAELDEARANLVSLLDRMEGMISGGWLIGGTYSLADIAVAPFIKRIEEEIAPEEVTATHRPQVAAWWVAVTSRPAYARANFAPFVD
jgi:glutathione S-transferase